MRWKKGGREKKANMKHIFGNRLLTYLGRDQVNIVTIYSCKKGGKVNIVTIVVKKRRKRKTGKHEAHIFGKMLG